MLLGETLGFATSRSSAEDHQEQQNLSVPGATLLNMRTFTDADLPDQWYDADLAGRIKQGRPECDALVLRVLAARIATAETNQDRGMTVKDLSFAVESLSVATANLIDSVADDDADDLTEIRQTVDALKKAHDGLHQLISWF